MLLLKWLTCVTDMLLVTTNPFDYHFCSQGVTTVEGINDGEELKLTDVRNTHSSQKGHVLYSDYTLTVILCVCVCVACHGHAGLHSRGEVRLL